ncbi:dihydrodipicolinate synthase family protein [Paraburkholderia tropica]|uniref:dihydrodipicolinate synthase family protein n=1 Tax=Paraburkholderia tropica TaxID=92647 RepID=UPI002AB08AB1|nr:dihydrodipicolinate synthase family protein [Paraburkholderia tropica]
MPVEQAQREALSHRFYSALVLPLKEDDAVDESGLRRLVRYYVDNARFSKVGGVIANAEAGEAFYLSDSEKRRALEIVLDEVNGRIPVLAGTFAWNTKETVELARHAKVAGASGIFVIPPAGSMDVAISWDSTKYPEVWLDQIKAQDAAVDMPIFTHPVSSPSQPWGIGLPLTPTLQICREVPNIVGWKTTYAYPGHRLLARGLREHAPGVALLCSSAHFFHEYLSVGNMDGTISGSWNYALEPMLDHIGAMQNNDLAAARRIWDGGLVRLHEYVYAELGRLHVRYKVSAWMRGLVDLPFMRDPMPRPRAVEFQTIRKLMLDAGIEVVRSESDIPVK